MLRDKSLIPLSRQHQHALALCVRIDRASPIPEVDLGVWQDEIAQHFQNEIGVHFAAEEQVLFPAARRFQDLSPLVEDLLSDHSFLRENFAAAAARKMTAHELAAFAQRLSAHIRKEERLLFERLQKCMRPEELATLGRELELALKDATDACILPSGVTLQRRRR